MGLKGVGRNRAVLAIPSEVNLKTVTSIPTLINLLEDPNRVGGKIGFVPTLGSLHEGHISLIESAKSESERTVVSIFVNPLQFTEEGYKAYPRNLESDSDKAEKAGVDILFVPEADEIFPPGYQSEISLPQLFKTLEAQKIIWHYKGVLAVVLKLFSIVRPDRAYFGMKDPHQLVLIKKMCRDFNLSVEIVECETIREGDGLAKSSRNALLSADERGAAAVIYRALCMGAGKIERSGLSAIPESLKIIRDTIEKEPLARIEHLEISDDETLEPAGPGSRGAFAYAAVSIGGDGGGKRLADNVRFRLK